MKAMIYEFFADGFEELEAIAPLDLLRRAGIAVQSVGVGGRTVTGRGGIAVTCDITVDEIDMASIGGVILPGGPGYTKLGESAAVMACVGAAAQRGKLLAAICAAPSILGRGGYLKGRRACCYPGYEKDLLGAEIVFTPAVRDGSVITSRGAGTSMIFALMLVAHLTSPAKAAEIASQIQCPTMPT